VTPPQLSQYLSDDALRCLVSAARREDLGPDGVDVTCRAMGDAMHRLTMGVMRSRVPGRVAGLAATAVIAEVFDAAVTLETCVSDGSAIDAGAPMVVLRGPVCGLLGMERVALNFITHLSGIATLTARFVDAVADTQAVICDTRKTLPGLRALEKYAVACGGGVNHRLGLHDAVMIKDNHLASLSASRWDAELRELIVAARHVDPAPAFVQVEVDTLEQLRTVLNCGPDMLLLDNMDPRALSQAVAMRDDAAPNVLLEASGGVTLDTVRAIALSGVDRISVGAVTMSAPALDIGLDMQ